MKLNPDGSLPDVKVLARLHESIDLYEDGCFEEVRANLQEVLQVLDTYLD